MLVVRYTNKFGDIASRQADVVQVRPDGTVECYREIDGELVGTTQLEPKDVMGRIIIKGT